MELAQIDQCLREKDFTQALVLLFQTLNNIEFGEDLLLDDYTHLAECFSSCVKDPECEISDQIFYALLIHQHKIRDLLTLCDPDKKLQALSAVWVKKNRRAQNKAFLLQGLKRYYLCYDWTDRPIMAWTKLMEMQGDWFLAFALSSMAHQAILSKEQIKHLTHFEMRLTEFKLPILLEHCVPLLVRAWDQLIYRADIHGFRMQRWLNHVLQRWLRSVIPPNMDQRVNAAKPKILIVLEHFQSNHALYRCLAPMVKLLADEFDCIALCVAERIDSKARELFTTVLEVDWKVPRDIRNIVRQIREIAPTVVYYPSLGMHSIAVCLANCRLAPLQILAPGQAATSAHAELDHVMVFSEFFHPDARRSEKPIILPENQFRFVLPEEAKSFTPNPIKTREKIQIVVPATHFKLNVAFLERCVAIQNQSPQPVQFHFTPYSTGLAYYAHRQAIHDFLPDAVVHPKYEYAEYIALLGECDFALMTTPFGGSNSSVDLCAIGIPFVCQVGVEPFARVDASLSKIMQLPAWCRTVTEKDYIAAAIRLITNTQERHDLTELMRANQDKLQAISEFEFPPDYATLIADLIKNHDEQQAHIQVI